MTRERDAANATVVGIDLGTGSVRAGLYSLGSALLTAAEAGVTTAHPRPGWAEQSPGRDSRRAAPGGHGDHRGPAAGGRLPGLGRGERARGRAPRRGDRAVAALDGHPRGR